VSIENIGTGNEMSFNLASRLGAYPSPWDKRHFRIPQVTRAQVAEIPTEYDELLDWAPTNVDKDQGNIGSCVGWDGNFIMEMTNTLLLHHAELSNRRDLLQYVLLDLSAGWLYHWSRYYANIPDWVEGSTNLGLMKALNKKGAATEECVPTDTQAPWDGINPCEEAEEQAAAHAIDSYWMVNPNPNDIKAAIYGLTHEAPYKMPDGTQGKIPLVSAFPVYESFSEGYDDGIVPMPKQGERLLGGHSSPIIGWNLIDDGKYWINFGSWGEDIGDKGLFYLPEDYPFYQNDFWLIHNGPPVFNGSNCKIGKGVASVLNAIPTIFDRKGRFRYS